jgi:hypothetical protein
MPETITPQYLFMRGRRCILSEVLFPKKVVYQREIFTALEEGLDEDLVKTRMLLDSSIIEEIHDYPQLFDPEQYTRKILPRDFRVPTWGEAMERIKMYHSHFRGWSLYEVDGVFIGEETEDIITGRKKLRIDDERTQVVRLIFQVESVYEAEAKSVGCYDVLEALMRWTMAEHMRLDHILPWSRGEKRRFVSMHGAWPEYKRSFVNKFYEAITKEVKKWIDDISLFIFGYLVKRFWKEVISRGRREDEIWVISWFNANLNIVKRIE